MTDDDTPHDELAKLAEAKTPQELVKAHRDVRRAIQIRRAKAARTQGPLAQTYVAAMEQWDQEKADGIPKAERLQHLETILRAAWPQVREWKFNCNRCHDTGWAEDVCTKGHRCNGISSRLDGPGGTPGRYRRLCAQEPESDYEHDYVTACFCEKGEGFRRAMNKQPKPARAEDFAESGKTKPMTKLGR